MSEIKNLSHLSHQKVFVCFELPHSSIELCNFRLHKDWKTFESMNITLDRGLGTLSGLTIFTLVTQEDSYISTCTCIYKGSYF